jgi:hypothetical protein
MSTLFKISVILFALHALSAYAFNGELEYKVTQSDTPPEFTKRLIIGIKNHRLRFQSILRIKDKEVIDEAYFDYSNSKGAIVKGSTFSELNLAVPYRDSKFTPPEEVTKKKGSKKILTSTVYEHGSYYLHKTTRLPITIWYSDERIFWSFTNAWHLHALFPEYALYNLLFHPVTRQIALEMTFLRSNGIQASLKCERMESKILPDEYFTYRANSGLEKKL